jgi:hypothetical protein
LSRRQGLKGLARLQNGHRATQPRRIERLFRQSVGLLKDRRAAMVRPSLQVSLLSNENGFGAMPFAISSRKMSRGAPPDR